MAEREKSALYPAVTWEECIDFIKNIIDIVYLKIDFILLIIVFISHYVDIL